MKVYLARHTRTNYNELGLCNADPSIDVHLSEIGLAQAKLLADKLKDESFEVIITSTLPRTGETAEIINKYHDVAISADARINDNATGFEGKPVAEYYGALDTTSDKWNFKGEGGESINDLRSRVTEFLDELSQKSFKSVLVVTHMSVIQAIYGRLQNLTNEEMWEVKVEQGNFTTVEL